MVGRYQDLPMSWFAGTHKSETCYIILFELKRHGVNTFNTHLSPENILTDFEIAVINAVKRQFPNCAHRLCLFHLTQSLWRHVHVQAEGLAKCYGTDFVFAHKIRHLFALAFLEPEEIPEAFEQVKNIVLPTEAEGLAQWFNKYLLCIWSNYKKI